MNRVFIWCLLFGCLIALTACENTGGKKAVSGTVELNGAPLDKGTINFFAQDSTTPAGGAAIENGRYAIPAQFGFLPGKYLVKLSAMPEADLTPEEMAAGKTLPPRVDRIPAVYNSASQQMIEVTAEGQNEFNFKIE